MPRQSTRTGCGRVMAHARRTKLETRESLVPGVSLKVYSHQDFDRVTQMIHRDAGIVLSERKQMLVYSRLAPLLRRSGLPTFGAYLDTLDGDEEQTTKVISALTTNHTYFNREAHHFKHFASHLRGDLNDRAIREGNVRIWSAGCSSGEELWTVLMFLLGEDRLAGSRIAKNDITAFGSDISCSIIQSAQKAVYPKDALIAVPAALRKNWCDPVLRGGKPYLSIRPELRKMAQLSQLNLLGPWPFQGLFDVIFCRNVIIYFDQETKEDLLVRLAQQLRPGGTLYIGHSERVTGAAAALLDPIGPTIYQRSAA